MDMYRCISCRREVKVEPKTTPKIQCPYCGYRIIEKMRPKIVKKLRAK